METDLIVQLGIKTELQRLCQAFDASIFERYAQRMLALIPPESPIEEIIYNVAFWTQALLKDEKSLLRWADPKKILYSDEKRVIPIIPNAPIRNKLLSYIPPLLILRYLIQNFSEVESQLIPFFEEQVSPALQNGNLILLSNHTSWMNFPLLAILFNQLGGIPKDHIFTLLGPAITTNEFAYSGIVNFSTLIGTIPDTTRGNFHKPYQDLGMLEVKTLAESIKKRTGLNIMRIFKGKKIGSVLFIAPSGTTDEHRNGNFILAKPSDGTYELLDSLRGNPKNEFVIFGINDKEIMSNNTKIERGKIYTSFSKKDDYDKTEPPRTLVRDIRRHVLDSKGNPIGILRDE